MAAIMPSVAPQVTVTSVSGSTCQPGYQRVVLAAIASRKSRAPQVMAYWLMSASIAAFAASFSSGGQAKSGKPWARLTASWSAAWRVISRITDSVKLAARIETLFGMTALCLLAAMLDPVKLTLPGTAEPSYRPPDAELRRAADEWVERIRPDRLRELVTDLPGPRNRFNAADAMERTDALLADAWRAAGWRVGRQHLHLRNLNARLDHPVAGSRGRHPIHRYDRLEGRNLVAIAEGDTDDAIVLVAHHYTVRGSPDDVDEGAGEEAVV